MPARANLLYKLYGTFGDLSEPLLLVDAGAGLAGDAVGGLLEQGDEGNAAGLGLGEGQSGLHLGQHGAGRKLLLLDVLTGVGGGEIVKTLLVGLAEVDGDLLDSCQDDKHVGVKLGADGCYVCSNAFCGTVAPFCTSVLDTTGAGDNFMAGLIHGVLRGWTIQDCVTFANAAGVRTDASVTAICDGKAIASDRGELQLTAYGISGIPVFQISRYVAKALYLKQNAKVKIDFLPEMSENEFLSFLLGRKEGREQMTCADYLLGIFHQKLIPRFLEQARIRMHTLVQELSETQFKSLVQAVKRNVVLIDATNGFDNAQVCAGGISTIELSARTMESRYIKGLYLTGELLDADGICGGYNLQWAWATGYLAGKAAADTQ